MAAPAREKRAQPKRKPRERPRYRLVDTSIEPEDTEAADALLAEWLASLPER